VERAEVHRVQVVLITGDRGLAGAYNANVIRRALETFRDSEASVSYIVVGRRGRDMLARRGVDIRAEFSDLPTEPSFADVSAIGRLVVDEFLQGRADQVFLIYTDFVSLMTQVPTVKKLLPFEVEAGGSGPGEARLGAMARRDGGPEPAYIYEPSQEELVNRILPRLTELQVYQAILESQASEHAARMVAMRHATENASELVVVLRLDYNKARQQAITSDMLDIVGGAEALART
jgi:F-type H+-transporting ATPase subunit gamma